jgi:hypothetical protein
MSGRTLADWLSLAASPLFAAMALLTIVQGDDPVVRFCTGGSGSSPLHGVALMYGLMFVVHLSPWLKLIHARAH